jgi:hypothetical protein
MKNTALFLALIITSVFTYGQNLIGYKSREIQTFMKENRQDMNSETVANSSFNYLRYSDNNDNVTLIFFLNNDSICSNIKMICDKSIKAEKLKEFNSLYKPNGANKWIDIRDGKNFTIEIREEKWSFDVIIESEK